MSVRKFFNYNVYLASVYTFLRLRYQTRTTSSALRKLSPFVGAAIVLPTFPSVDFLNRLKLGAWSPFTKPEEAEAAALGIKIRNKKDITLLKDVIAADKLYDQRGSRDRDKIYELLIKHKDSDEPEVLWRLARIIYDKNRKTKVATKELHESLHEALSLVEKSLELDEANFGAHKWMAILLNEVSVHTSLKEQILQAENVKKHMTRAAELNPTDPTSVHLLGRWCFSVADVPYWQRKAAATFIATPPTCEFQEALGHFLRAEKMKPHFYSMNLLMLAKCYIRMGDLDGAYNYLTALENYKPRTEEDYEAMEEGSKLWRAHKTYFFRIRAERVANGQAYDVKVTPIEYAWTKNE